MSSAFVQHAVHFEGLILRAFEDSDANAQLQAMDASVFPIIP